jgi:hypothetical protein
MAGQGLACGHLQGIKWALEKIEGHAHPVIGELHGQGTLNG